MTRSFTPLALAAATLGAFGCARDDATATAHAPRTIMLTSPAFEDGAAIPRKHTCDGDDLSPPLTWDRLPDGAKSLALIVEDPDAPRGTFTHWVLYDLPATETGLDAGVPARSEAARQGKNDFGKAGYGGPCPPRGSTHRYVFTLFALDVARLGLDDGASKRQVLDAVSGHVLAEGRLTGTYARSGG